MLVSFLDDDFYKVLLGNAPKCMMFILTSTRGAPLYAYWFVRARAGSSFPVLPLNRPRQTIYDNVFLLWPVILLPQHPLALVARSAEAAVKAPFPYGKVSSSVHSRIRTITVTIIFVPKPLPSRRQGTREHCWRHCEPPESPGQTSRGRLGGHQSAHGRSPERGSAGGRAHNGRAYSRGAERNNPRPPPVFPAPRGRFGGGWRGARPRSARVAPSRAKARAPRLPSGRRGGPHAGVRPPGRARRPAPRSSPPARECGAGGRGRAAPLSGGRGAASAASRVARCVCVCVRARVCVRAWAGGGRPTPSRS